MRLLAVQEEVNIEENRKLVGTEVELLVAAGEGRKNAATQRLSGRARDGRLVHFRPEGNLDGTIRPGDVVTVVVTHGAPHHLVADDGVLTHRRTRAGDSFEKGITPKTPAHRRRSRTTEDRCPGPTTRPDGMQRMTSQHENTTPQPGDGRLRGLPQGSRRRGTQGRGRNRSGCARHGCRGCGARACRHPCTAPCGSCERLGCARVQPGRGTERIALFSRLFVWFVVIFGIGFSMLALVTRRWSLALGRSRRQCRGERSRHDGRLVASDHSRRFQCGRTVDRADHRMVCRRVLDVPLAQGVWTRTNIQLAAEEQRRIAAAEAEKHQEWNVG